MRFSMKWLLAAVTYAAVVCASIAVASDVWIDLTVYGGLLAFIAAVIGVIGSRRGIRAFSVGFAVTYLLLRLTLYLPLNALADFKGAADDLSDRIVSWRRPISPDLQNHLEQLLASNEKLGKIWSVDAYSDDLVKVNYTVLRPTNTMEEIREELVPQSKVGVVVSSLDARRLGKQHLTLACSLLGGLLGLWFWKREERMSESH